MNPPQDHHGNTARDRLPQLAAAPRDVEVWLDRLVDGELDDAQRRALLLQLEDQPQGWRRCALAFLEAQAWGGELQRVAAGEAEDEAAEPVSPAPSRDAGPRRLPPYSALAMAASFLVAFGLGVIVQNVWRGGAAPDGTIPSAADSNGHLADGPAAEHPGAGALVEASPTGAVGGREPTANWGTVQLVVDGQDGSREQVALPVVEGPGVNDWLGQQRPGLPPELIEAIERQGHRVQTERRLIEVPLEDGRRVLVPVDDVEVHPRGGVKRYQ